MYKIIFYTDKKGESEIANYLQSLRHKKSKDAKIKLYKITAYMNQLSKNGIIIGEPYIKHLQGDIWELRPLRDRILFALLDKNIIILLSRFIKQTQKTPQKEIEKAKKNLKDYIERKTYYE